MGLLLVDGTGAPGGGAGVPVLTRVVRFNLFYPLVKMIIGPCVFPADSEPFACRTQEGTGSRSRAVSSWQAVARADLRGGTHARKAQPAVRRGHHVRFNRCGHGAVPRRDGIRRGPAAGPGPDR